MMRSKQENLNLDNVGCTTGELTVRAKKVANTLHEVYGSPRHGNKDDPLDELVFIILSQMTTHHSFGRVYDRLKLLFPDWSDVRGLPVEQLAEVIKDAGLSNQKAPRIKAILERVFADFGKVSLAHLGRLSDAEAEQYLTSLPGVGTKTAKCVLMYSLDRAVLPVDTHVWRLSKRLGLVQGELSYSTVHEALENVVLPEDRYSFHVNAISHGRAVCLAKKPRCVGCPLMSICPSWLTGHPR